MAEIIQLNDLARNNEALQPLLDLISQLVEMPEEGVTDDVVDMMKGMIQGAFTPAIKAEAIKNMTEAWEGEGVSRYTITNNINAGKQALEDAINELTPSDKKRKMINGVLTSLYDIIDAALEKYHNYSIELPIKLDEGAHMPTYAHEGDAAADLYALETTEVAAHSLSNKIKTGVHLQLPEGWIAKLAPRSSIGAKTPLRLSNELGIIDSKKVTFQWVA